jgi:hypothetical protein
MSFPIIAVQKVISTISWGFPKCLSLNQSFMMNIVEEKLGSLNVFQVGVNGIKSSAEKIAEI